MNHTKAATTRLLDMVADNPHFLHPMITDDVRALLAAHDRREKALREINELLDGTTPLTHHIKKLAKEALCDE